MSQSEGEGKPGLHRKEAILFWKSSLTKNTNIIQRNIQKLEKAVGNPCGV
jgi:hypothetical protein